MHSINKHQILHHEKRLHFFQEAYIMEALEKESGTESGVLLTATLTWFKKNT